MRKTTDLKGKSKVELEKELAETRLNLAKLKASVRLGTEKNSAKVKELKLHIARILTTLSLQDKV